MSSVSTSQREGAPIGYQKKGKERTEKDEVREKEMKRKNGMERERGKVDALDIAALEFSCVTLNTNK